MLSDGTLDRRVRKTRAQLRSCLAKLLKTKKIQEISVKEISEMADINRGTFYLHYKDVYDLLSNIENDMLAEFNKILSKHYIESIGEHPSILIAEIFSLIKNNSDITQILLGPNGDITFQNQIKALMRERILREWASRLRKQQLNEFEAFYAFVIAGCLGLIDHWFSEELKQSPQELAALAERFILDGLNSFIIKDNSK